MQMAKAGYIDLSVLQTSDGTLTTVDFPDDVRAEQLAAVASATHATAGGWVDVRPYTILSVAFHADTEANGNGCDFTVEAVPSSGAATAQAYDFTASFTVATDTLDTTTVKGASIKEVAFIRVLESGTSADVQYVSVLVK